MMSKKVYNNLKKHYVDCLKVENRAVESLRKKMDELFNNEPRVRRFVAMQESLKRHQVSGDHAAMSLAYHVIDEIDEEEKTSA
jgi:hypothetical protein